MDAFASALIDAMGGTTNVARLAKAPITTVHNWRRSGLAASRLDHLRRIAEAETPHVDIAALAAHHGVDLGGARCADCQDDGHAAAGNLDRAIPSSGKADEISAPAVPA